MTEIISLIDGTSHSDANILALNAAVERLRGRGDHGKGYSRGGREVRIGAS